MTQQHIDTTASPATQVTGLAAFELAVTSSPLLITWNEEAISAAVDALLENYTNLVVTEEMVTPIKSEMAGLNKLHTKLNDARKDIAKTIKAPLDEFENSIKGMCAKVLQVRGVLDTQVKDFDQRDRESRRAKIQFMIDAAKTAASCTELSISIDERWLNKSASAKTTQAEIENIILKHQQEQAKAALLERAKQDRVDAVSKEVAAQSKHYGFELPLSRFMDCMGVASPMDDVIIIIGSTYAAEKEKRDKQEALRAQHAAPVAPAAPIAPASGRSLCPPPPPAPAIIRRTMNIRLCFEACESHAVTRLLHELRGICTVEIQ